MTALVLFAAEPGAVEDPRTRQIVDALDPAFLRLVGWDWDLRVIFFPKDHPVLGVPDCRVKGCTRGVRFGRPMCMGCERTWKDSVCPWRTSPRSPSHGCWACAR